MKYRLGELFSGPGGLALGAFSAKIKVKGVDYGITHGWASDYDPDTCRTYRENIAPNSSETVVCEDVRNLDLKTLSEIDGFAYGFPCNDFSIVGEKKGIKGKFGPLYRYGVEVLNEFQPKFFVAENVGGITSANEGRTFEMILEHLRKSGNGYNVTAHLYKAEQYGVPQTRHRIIIVGIDKDFDSYFRVPKPTTFDRPITSGEALRGIAKNAPNNERTLQSPVVIERLKLIRPGENIWQTKLPKRLQLDVKGAKLSQIYKRLDPSEPSYTITGSGGGGTHGYHWKEPRALTNRERARLQTFPDDFVFYGSKESVRKQIGMAVPVELSRVIFTAVLRTLHGVKYNSVDPSIGYF